MAVCYDRLWHINANLIEANMLLSRISIYLIVLFPEIFLTLYCLAIVNLIFTVINLFFGAGLDGMHVLEDIWENDQLFATFMRKVIKKGNEKIPWGINDYTAGFALGILGIIRIGLFCLILTDIWAIFL